MLTEGQGERLPGWLDAVRQDDLPSFHALAAGLERDQDAVIAGLTCPGAPVWSKGMSTGSRCSSARGSAAQVSNFSANAPCWHESGWDGAGRIRTGVLLHAVKARQPLRYEPHPAAIIRATWSRRRGSGRSWPRPSRTPASRSWWGRPTSRSRSPRTYSTHESMPSGARSTAGPFRPDPRVPSAGGRRCRPTPPTTVRRRPRTPGPAGCRHRLHEEEVGAAVICQPSTAARRRWATGEGEFTRGDSCGSACVGEQAVSAGGETVGGSRVSRSMEMRHRPYSGKAMSVVVSTRGWPHLLLVGPHWRRRTPTQGGLCVPLVRLWARRRSTPRVSYLRDTHVL